MGGELIGNLKYIAGKSGNSISIEDKDFVLSILKLSVDSLPHFALKQCFACCSNFLKDYEFDKEEVIQMWIAEGFIQPNKKEKT